MNRIKRLSVVLIVVFLGMFTIPLIAVNGGKPNDVMLVLLFLFYAVSPVVSVILGITSGMNIKFFWFVPILIVVLFWVFSTIEFKSEYPMIYSRIHLALCGITMAITVICNRKKT